MSNPTVPSVYIRHLQAIPPSLLFLVPLATIVVFLPAVSHTVLQHRRESVLNTPLLGRRKTRVVWAFPVVFSFALLAILSGTLLFFRERSPSVSLAVADSVVTSVLYLELSLSAICLLTPIKPVVLCVYGIILGTILTSAALISILGPFMTVPPLLSPILYLVMAAVTMPLIAFSFLSAPQPSEASVAPEINYPAFPSEKPGTLDVVSSRPEMPASYAARNVSVYVLCGQISAIMHFTFAIGILVLLPDQSSPPSTLTGEELATGVWIQALVFRIVQTVLLVFWIICIMSAFVQLFTSVNRQALSVTTITTLSDAATFTTLPSRTYHPRSKSRSSSFSSPRPRRDPLPRPGCTRRSTPPGADDFQNLHDPFASPSTRGSKVDAENARAHNDGTRPTRMSAWGTLPPRPPPNVLVINPPAARRLPTLRGKQSDCSMSLFSYTTPSAYSQDTDAEVQEFDLEEALLAQKLLWRLDSAEVTSGRWIGSKLGRSGRELRMRE